jgi:hypothetical protein
VQFSPRVFRVRFFPVPLVVGSVDTDAVSPPAAATRFFKNVASKLYLKLFFFSYKKTPTKLVAGARAELHRVDFFS